MHQMSPSTTVKSFFSWNSIAQKANEICDEILPYVCELYGILLPKLFWPTVRKKCSGDREKLLKFEAEGQ